MASPRKIVKSNLPKQFLCEAIAFVGRSSFEERGFSAINELSTCHFVFKHFFTSKNENDLAFSLRKSQGLSESECSTLDTCDPLQTQSLIADQLEAVTELKRPFSLVVDITTFRREELLILQKELQNLPRSILEKTCFVYSIASNMGSWLSNAVREIRPVIGFPGDMRTSRKTHLVILAGIEHHRVLAMIDAYEPSSISLGFVPQSESVSDEIFRRNEQLRDDISSRFDNISREFEFSAKDPKKARDALQAIEEDKKDENLVVAPLNTKLSTLGCGAFALENPRVQLCYAEVEVYNAGDYSTAGDDIYLVQYQDLFSSEGSHETP